MDNKDGQQARILVINDDMVIARFWEIQFQNVGYTVKLAGSVRHALWLMEDDHFDMSVFIFDIPPLRDLIVLHELREKHPQLKLMVYGLVKTRMVMNYLTRAGANVILNRTVGIKEVIQTAKETLATPVQPAASNRRLT